MADQHIRRRRHKKKGKRGHKGARPHSNRDPSPEKMKVINASPHLRTPGYEGGQKMLPEHLEGKIFLKFTNKEEMHNGYQWRTGLNKDHLKFRRSGPCGPGGLFFCELHDLYYWAGHSDAMWVRVVHPQLDGEGKQVLQLQNKWKAHSVVAEERRSLLDYRTWEWLLRLESEGSKAVFDAVPSSFACALLSKSRYGALLRESTLECLGGTLQDVLKSLNKSMHWSDTRLSAMSELYKNKVSLSDWRACRTVYPSLRLSSVSLRQIVSCLTRPLMRMVKHTKKDGSRA